MTVTTLIAAELLKNTHAACGDYPLSRLRELYPGDGRTLLEVLTLCDGPWSDVPDRDRVWTATRPGVLTRPQRLEFLARLVERSLGRLKNPDPRSLAVVPALRADAVTVEILSAATAAYAAAYDADAAYAAAYDAAYAYDATAAYAAAAYAAAYDAAYDAADDERKKQVEDLIEIITQSREQP